MNTSHRLMAGCALLCLTVATAPAAFAQSPTPPASPNMSAPSRSAPKASEETTLSDVVVTATRTPSLASKTPVSIEVYSSEALASKGINNIQALATMDPSLNINAGGGEPYLALRGVSSSDTTEVGDPAVPVSIDNLFTDRSYSLNSEIFDINRIEILRGPQGTLFGRNAIGGVVNIYTNDPGTSYGGYGEIDAGNYGKINTAGAINVPVTDTFQARLAFATENHDGYRNIGPAGRGDNQNTKSIRLKLAWEPIEKLRLNFQYQFVKVNDTGIADEVVNYPNGVINPNITYSGNGRNFTLPFKPNQILNENTYHWGATYEGLPDGMTLSYLGGYDTLLWTRTSNQSQTADNAFIQRETPSTLNQEIRLASDQSKRFIWQIGAFYFLENSSLNTNLVDNYQTSGAFTFASFKYPSVSSQSLAGYGQATYAVTDFLKLTGGLRYTEDNKSTVNGVFSLPLFGVVIPENGKSQSGVLTYHFGGQLQAAPASMIYVSIDKGYKAGGYNNGVPYLPEYVQSYELGSKNRFFNNHANLNVDIFYEDYTNQQIFQQEALSTGTSSVVVNAGKSRIYGAELNGIINFDEIGRLDLNISALNARFVNFLTTNVYQTANTQLSGKSLPDAPDLSLTAGFERRFITRFGSITPRIDTKYQSTQFFTIYNLPDGRQGPNLVSNASVTFTPPDKGYTLEAYVRNLTNATVLTDFTENNTTDIYGWGFAPPRTYGVRLRVDF